MEYIIFTDESANKDSHYQSLAALSIPRVHYDTFKTIIINILKESNVSEFKWTKVRNAKNFFCAEKIIKAVIDNIILYDLRIDTLVWDNHDKRHSIIYRDEQANFERMFFHLLNNAMVKRLKGSTWHVRTDVRGGINWKQIHDCLNSKGKTFETSNTLFGVFINNPSYIIVTFKEKESHKEPLIQIADLFSGIAIFSRVCYNEYMKWKSVYEKEINIFSPSDIDDLSNREEYRCKLLDYFNNECKINNLGVSLNSNKKLYTYKPSMPLNFWNYQPQGDYDKAPLKKFH
jgi:hypothetical protein